MLISKTLRIIVVEINDQIVLLLADKINMSSMPNTVGPTTLLVLSITKINPIIPITSIKEIAL